MPQQITGIGVYAQQLLLELIKKNPSVKCVFKGSRFFAENSLLDKTGLSASPYWPVLNDLWLKSSSIFHGPDFKMICENKKIPRVVTVHDLVVFHDGFNDPKFRERGQQALHHLLDKQRPDHIIVPSRVIQEELIERFPHYKDRVTAIHHGGDHLYQSLSEKSEPVSFNSKSLFEQPYFLFVGHLENRKNLSGMIKAFEVFCEKNKEHQFVVIGKNGFGAENIHALISSSKYKARIHWLGYVSQSELKNFYAHACAFVFASYYEGFGFPIIEAMIEGAPVITSNYGAMKEVAGEAALFVDPKEIESMVAAFHNVIDPSLREMLISKGQIRAQDFRWSSHSDQTLSVYHNISY